MAEHSISCQGENMITIGVYIDNCICLFATLFVADVVERIFKALREYFIYSNYYLPEQRLQTALARAFQYNSGVNLLFIVVLLASLCRVSFSRHFYIRNFIDFFVYIPTYWIWRITLHYHSSLDYAYWLRGNHGLDIAAGLASSFFHGYLKLILPSYNDLGIRDRIDIFEKEHRVKFITNRLVILVPSELCIKSKIESEILEKVAPLEVVRKDRAGVFRPYQNDVYRFKKPINGIYYYIALESATPMLTFFESISFDLTATWQMKAMKREVLLKFCKYVRKLLSEWHETENGADLILYNAYKDNGEPQDVGEMLRAYFLKKLICNK